MRDVRATRVWLTAFVGALLLFGATLAPDVLMMDSGEYQVAAYRFPNLELGPRPADLVRVHPVYLAAAKLIGLVPIGGFAARVNFVSALFGAAAVANAALLAGWLARSERAAWLAALVLSFGHTLWAFSVIAEVMSMLAAMLTAELLFCWLYFATGRRHWLLALALLNGLGVATHLQLGLETPLYAITLLLLCRRRILSVRFLMEWATVWLIGTLPYSAMVAYYGIRTGDWAFILSSAAYGRFGAPPHYVSPRTLARGLAAILLNYPTLLVAFAVPGIVRLRRESAPLFTAVFLGTIAIQLLFVLTYNVPDQYSFFVPVYAVIAVLIGLGAAGIAADRTAFALLAALAILPAPIYAVAAPALRKADVQLFHRTVPYRDPYDFFIKPWKCGDRGQRRYVTEAFAELSPNAVLLTSYTMRYMLEYAQLVDRLRPDVLLVDDPAALSALLETSPDGEIRWRRPVFANDVRARDFPAVIARQCRPHQVGLLWKLDPPQDPATFRAALIGELPVTPTPPPSPRPPSRPVE